MTIRVFEDNNLIQEVPFSKLAYDSLGEACREWNSINVLQRYIQIHDPNRSELQEAKLQKIKELRGNTAGLVLQGFVFDGKTFSLSDNAQMKINAIKTLLDSGSLGEETSLSTIDDELYVLARQDADSFISAAYERLYNQIVLVENVLKQQVLNLSTVEEVNNFVDPRI